MPRPRIIPVLLLTNGGLVKSENFKNYNYIGDPINAVKIFNDLKADELVFLDVEATVNNRLIDSQLVTSIGEEANMPFAVGGGISTIEDIQKVIHAGAEKVVICSAAVENPDFIRKAAETFGSSTICVCMDVKKKFLKGTRVYSHGGTKASSYTPIEFAKLMQENGAGELIVQSIENDGAMKGYDLELIKSISEVVTIPVIALGGAATMKDVKSAHENGFVSGAAAGSMFVYKGTMKGVLINYPEKEEVKRAFS
jgi:cyclase